MSGCVRSLILLCLGCSVLSCRHAPPPRGGDLLDRKLQNIQELESAHEHPANAFFGDMIGQCLAQLRNDLDREKRNSIGDLLPPFEGGPAPSGGLPHDEFVAKTLLFQFQHVRWFEDVWLIEATPKGRAATKPKDHAETREFADDSRGYCMDLLAEARRDHQESAFALTPEQVAFVRTRVDERTKALATEKDPERHAYLEFSAAWWKARLAESAH